jgi:hypothetical protein
MRINQKQIDKFALSRFDETSMIQLTQTLMKIHHASSIRPIKNKLYTDENFAYRLKTNIYIAYAEFWHTP